MMKQLNTSLYALSVTPYNTATISIGKCTIFTNDENDIIVFSSLVKLNAYMVNNNIVIAINDVTPHLQPCNIYVSPTGLNSGGLTIDTPVSLKTALNSTNIKPGDTIHLRGGVYQGDFISTIKGTELMPITIIPYESEKPIIDGDFSINSEWVNYYGVEHLFSEWTTRTSQQPGIPTDIPIKELGLDSGKHNKIIGWIIHDIANIMLKELAENIEVYGCLIYNIGWIGSDRGHGHGLYFKNAIPTKIGKRNVIINTFRHAINVYSEGTSKGNYVELSENVCINAGSPVGATLRSLTTGGDINAQAPINPKWISNMLYNAVGNVGSAVGVNGMTRINNYMPFGCAEYGTITYTENTGNTLTKPESGLVQFCYGDEYSTIKGTLTVYNWGLLESVQCDLSAITGLSIGDTVRLRSVEDYFNCYQDLVLDADKKVTINMSATGKTVATAIGHNYTPATNFPEFGCFMIEKF